nr:hypothetical protein [Sinorhizobium sp. M14]
MIVVAAIRRILYLIALLGIVFGPVSISTAASAMALSSDMQMKATSGMDDMSCCPEELPSQNSDCGKACPLVLVCSSIILVHQNTAEGWSVALNPRSLPLGTFEESNIASAVIEPPARPPKA